jgi:hypothetical protein
MEYDLRQTVKLVSENRAIVALNALDLDVHLNGQNGHVDLIVNGRLRVEVKGAFFTSHKTRTGRYQFNTRNYPDVYVLHCLGDVPTSFVIPQRAIGDRRNVAIWSRDPRDYKGRWAKYRNAWHVVLEELERCQKA